ncbi:hypothetical protein [Pyrodictium abyssi]|uniref:Uncharacterized protein n=1 Tax=Pyrodictium abyssi TaxID=54256 RepID=A0ABN6ZLZ1_9CREN|nr:hypothetical protein PABY_08390 [Pyrodictium abyssi]
MARGWRVVYVLDTLARLERDMGPEYAGVLRRLRREVESARPAEYEELAARLERLAGRLEEDGVPRMFTGRLRECARHLRIVVADARIEQNLREIRELRKKLRAMTRRMTRER